MTRNISKTAEKQLTISERPLVGLDDSLDALTAGDINFLPNGDAYVNYVVKAKNFSNNSAQNVFASAQLMVTEDTVAIHESEKGICSESAVGNRDLGMVLFPGKLRTFNTSQSWYPRKQMVSKSYDNNFEGWLVGCIGYRDQVGQFYHTGFAYWLVQKSTERPVQIPPDQRTPVTGDWVSYTGSVN